MGTCSRIERKEQGAQVASIELSTSLMTSAVMLIDCLTYSFKGGDLGQWELEGMVQYVLNQ